MAYIYTVYSSSCMKGENKERKEREKEKEKKERRAGEMEERRR